MVYSIINISTHTDKHKHIRTYTSNPAHYWLIDNTYIHIYSHKSYQLCNLHNICIFFPLQVLIYIPPPPSDRTEPFTLDQMIIIYMPLIQTEASSGNMQLV